MSGRLAVIGLGPGDQRYLTQEAREALETAHALYGYGPYLDRVPMRPGQARHASDNREDSARAQAALRHAAQGANIAVVSGGDPGVFAMAARTVALTSAGTRLEAVGDKELVGMVLEKLDEVCKIAPQSPG